MLISTPIMRVANIVIPDRFFLLIMTHELTLGVASVYRVGLLVIVIVGLIIIVVVVVFILYYYYFIFIISP